MRVHHLNCATLCLPMGRWLTGNKGGVFDGKLVCHCLLIETNDGLVLVDAGLGLADIAAPAKRLGRLPRRLIGPRLDPAESALRQVEALGFRAEDVRHLLITHLDLDHIGGLADFPQATLHLTGPQARVVGGEMNAAERRRFRSVQWSHGPHVAEASVSGERFMGFEAVRDLKGLPPEILLIPLSGHSEGHCGIAVHSDRGWLFHAGDAYYHRSAMVEPPGKPPLFARALDRFNTWDAEKMRMNRSRLQALVHDPAFNVRVFCSHDPEEYLSLAAGG